MEALLKTIGHHACEQTGGEEYVTTEAPFLSVRDEKKSKIPFLGNGYYFWDYNFEYAQVWGIRMVKGAYFIVECQISCEDSEMLDLVGRRQDMEWLLQKYDIAIKSGKLKSRTISALLTLLFELSQKKNKTIFPYLAVRAVDLDRNISQNRNDTKHLEQKRIKFVEGKKNITSLDPRLVICIYDKNCGIIKSKRIIYKSKK